MSPDQRARIIKSEAVDLGFDRCGIAPAAPIPRADFFRRWIDAGYAAGMNYLRRHVESRIDVRAWLPWARSVIVVAVHYNQSDPDIPDKRPRGRVARYAWGENYHVLLKEKLEALVCRMRTRFEAPFEAKVCVDTSAICERELAAAAGIGWIGKNTLVLNETLGSFFVLGEIITDLELPPDAPATDHCGSCTRCLDACPTSAFVAPRVMDARRCISYLTIEHRGPIAPELAPKLDDWLFGCDICQDVCPFNQHIPTTSQPRLAADTDHAFPPLDDIAAWDKTAYRSFVAGKTLSRAPLAAWQRNAALCSDNLAQSASRPPRVD